MGSSLVTVGVVVCKCPDGLSVPTLANEPTRTLRRKENEYDLGDGRKTLEEGGYTPCPGAVDVFGTKC